MTIAISATMMLLGIWFQCMHPKSLPAGIQIARKPSRAPSASIAHSIPLGFGSWKPMRRYEVTSNQSTCKVLYIYHTSHLYKVHFINLMYGRE